MNLDLLSINGKSRTCDQVYKPFQGAGEGKLLDTKIIVVNSCDVKLALSRARHARRLSESLITRTPAPVLRKIRISRRGEEDTS